MSAERIKIGFLAFPGVTQLDLTGPYEVLKELPNAEVSIVAKSTKPVTADGNFTFKPHKSLRQSPRLDILVIPGGPGVNRLLNDQTVLDYVKRVSLTAKYMTSVCTGALILGAAGLLSGRRATTHWMAKDFLKEFGATFVNQRIVIDGRIITAAGVSAGIDFGFILASELSGRETAKKIQLAIEYNPQPPFDSGSPEAAGEEIVRSIQRDLAARQEERSLAVTRAAKRLADSAG